MVANINNNFNYATFGLHKLRQHKKGAIKAPSH